MDPAMNLSEPCILKTMKKILFGIFAHPDDEAFGPAGTLLLETRAGTELHLITLTSGDGGTNLDNHENLGEVRLHEWYEAGKLLGAKEMHYLGYKDGKLNNHSMIEASERIRELIQAAVKDAPDDTEIEFMTMDLNGVTGHIDHIVAARAACLVFYTLKKTDKRFTRVRLACLTHDFYPTMNTRWLYMEQGRTPEEIDETVDARDLREDILNVMRAHYTQRTDADFHIKLLGDGLGLDHFIVKT